MQRIHVLGRNELFELSSNKSHVLLDSYISDRRAMSFYKHRSEQGEEILYVNSSKTLTVSLLKKLVSIAGISKVVFFMKDKEVYDYSIAFNKISLIQEFGMKSIVVLPDTALGAEEAYLHFINLFDNPLYSDYRCEVAFPCIPTIYGDGWGRFKLVHKLIHAKKWNLQRKYYFWEIENPAEFTAYTKAFMYRILDTMYGVISKRCYIDSMAGIEYSPSVGSFYDLSKHVDFDKVRYSYPLQFTKFMINDESIKNYISGIIGIGLWNVYRHRLESEAEK